MSHFFPNLWLWWGCCSKTNKLRNLGWEQIFFLTVFQLINCSDVRLSSSGKKLGQKTQKGSLSQNPTENDSHEELKLLLNLKKLCITPFKTSLKLTCVLKNKWHKKHIFRWLTSHAYELYSIIQHNIYPPT